MSPSMAVSAPTRLIGDPEENFYVLGKKHQGHFERFRDFLSTPQPLPPLRQWWRKPPEEPVTGTASLWLKSYCEGLEIPLATYRHFLQQAELGLLPGVVPGGLSAFTWDGATQGVTHLRVVDWPLAYLEGNALETILVTQPQGPGLLLLSIPGLPFLPLTLMNDAGLTLAIHGKPHSLTHDIGTPVGLMAIDAMLSARTCGELRKQLRQNQTRHLWGFHGCDPTHQVLSMDIGGPQVDAEIFTITPAEVLVFGSLPIVKRTNTTLSTPPLQSILTQQRLERVKLVLKEGQDAFLQMTLPGVQTLSSVQLLSLNSGTRRLETLDLETHIRTTWNNVFQNMMRQPDEQGIPPELTPPNPAQPARRYLARAQQEMDMGDVGEAFHQLQMGLALAPEDLSLSYAWVWPWWQWRYLEGRRDRLQLALAVEESLKRTPSMHRPHLQFLLFLLELELDLACTVAPPELPAPFKDWADAYLLAASPEREELIASLEARLDLQDLTTLNGPWTNEASTR